MSYSLTLKALAVVSRELEIPLDDLIGKQLMWTGCAECGLEYLAEVPSVDSILMMRCPECGFCHGKVD